MAWWNDGLTNVARRLLVLGRITDRFEQLAKLNPSPVGADDAEMLRIHPDGGGLQKWDGTAWVDEVVPISLGGTGAITADDARDALGITPGSLGSVVGTVIFERELTVKALNDATDTVRLHTNANGDVRLQLSVLTENFNAEVLTVNDSEGAAAFQVFDSLGNEIAAGFVDQVTSALNGLVPGDTKFNLWCTDQVFLGEDVTDRNLNVSLGALDSTVTVKIWKRKIATQDLSEDDSIKLSMVDLSTNALVTAWRSALGVGQFDNTALDVLGTARESNSVGATKRAIANAIHFANPDNWRSVGSYQRKTNSPVSVGRFVSSASSITVNWEDSNGVDSNTLLQSVFLGEKVIFTDTAGAFVGMLRADSVNHDATTQTTTITQTSGSANLGRLSGTTRYLIYTSYFYRRILSSDLDADVVKATHIADDQVLGRHVGEVLPIDKLGTGGDSSGDVKFLREDGVFSELIPFDGLFIAVGMRGASDITFHDNPGRRIKVGDIISVFVGVRDDNYYISEDPTGYSFRVEGSGASMEATQEKRIVNHIPGSEIQATRGFVQVYLRLRVTSVVRDPARDARSTTYFLDLVFSNANFTPAGIAYVWRPRVTE